MNYATFLPPPLHRMMADASPLVCTVGLLLAYPIVTTSLRFRRLRKLHKRYPYRTRESLAQMTDEEAFQIQKAVAQLEFPFMFIKALQFALFRVIILARSFARTFFWEHKRWKEKKIKININYRPTASQQSPTSSPRPANSPTQRPH